jgi:hypothetical protein
MTLSVPFKLCFFPTYHFYKILLASSENLISSPATLMREGGVWKPLPETGRGEGSDIKSG